MRSILLMLIDIHASLEQQLRELEASREVFAVSRCGEEPVAVAGCVVYVVGRVCVKPIAYAVNAAFSCVVVDKERNNHCSRVRARFKMRLPLDAAVQIARVRAQLSRRSCCW